MIKLSYILKNILSEQDINKDKILPFSYSGTIPNNMDNTEDAIYAYTFDSPNYEYTVSFFDSGGGFYERVFGTVERNLGPTKENMPYAIYRTVTAITLDFIERMNKANNFDTLIIEPISSQRSSLVKKFTDEYIAPKYNVTYDNNVITIKNK
jgi:hypothetical protein